MKKLVMVLFLLAGLSSVSSAQLLHRHDRSEANNPKHKVKVKKHQNFHFGKQEKDPAMAHNGSSYRKTQKYKVDMVSFKSTRPIKNNRKFTSQAASERKGYQQKLKTTVYSRRRPKSRFAV